MFGKGSAIISIREIHRIYPNQWVAISVVETDVDGFAVAGEVIVHDSDEKFVWTAARLGDLDDPIYVFYTGPPQNAAGGRLKASRRSLKLRMP